MPMSMSAVTSSPSPAASPRAAFHVPRSAYPAPSPRARPASQTTAPSPKRSSWNAPPPAYTTTTTSASGSKPPHVTAEQRGAGEKRAGYVDAGTQYSPDGYPPTAGGAFAAGGSKRLPPPDKEPDKKRKQRRDDSPEPMSTSGSSSGSSTAARRPPPEPEPRVNPQPVQQSSSSSSQSQQPEPQEARSTHTHSSAKRSRPEPGQVKMMPILYQNCHPKELGVLISNMLMELIRLNDQIPLRDGRLTRFHSRAPPGISVNDYLQRLIHHATLSPPILLSMVWYIDRLCQLYPAFTINSLTVHRFLITAVTVAAKGLSDSFWTNPTYAKIGGIPVSELATLELEFLQKVHWKIVPQPEVLEDYYRSLVERTDGYELEGSGSNASSSTSLGSTESEAAQSRDEEMVDEPT